jgi:hypothetical protein
VTKQRLRSHRTDCRDRAGIRHRRRRQDAEGAGRRYRQPFHLGLSREKPAAQVEGNERWNPEIDLLPTGAAVPYRATP